MPTNKNGRPGSSQATVDITSNLTTTFAGLPPAVKRYLAGLASICETGAHTTDERVAVLALGLIRQAPDELARWTGGAR